MLFLSLCRPEFLAYIIFHLSEQLLLTFLARPVYLTNSLNCCLSEKVFISPLLLKDNFTGYKIQGWWDFFPLNTLNISFHSLLTCMVSEEKMDVILIFASLWVRYFFPWLLSRLFFTFDFLQFQRVLFFLAMWLVGCQFCNQGLKPGHSSESPES